MKRILNISMAFVLLASPIFWLNCDGDNPAAVDLNDPSTFPGTYNFVSLTDKTGEVGGVPGTTFTAGEPLQLTIQGVTITITITGSLVLTETRYTFSQTVKVSVPGAPDVMETVSDTGTYSISGSTLSIVSDDGETDTITISVSGNRMTLEDDEIKLVLEKQ